MNFFSYQPDPKRHRFSIPNDVWKWELKSQGFAILAYLCLLHVHCNKDASPSADEIASQLHMSKDMAVKQLSELNRRGLLCHSSECANCGSATINDDGTCPYCGYQN